MRDALVGISIYSQGSHQVDQCQPPSIHVLVSLAAAQLAQTRPLRKKGRSTVLSPVLMVMPGMTNAAPVATAAD